MFPCLSLLLGMFESIVNDIVFLIDFSACTLLMHETLLVLCINFASCSSDKHVYQFQEVSDGVCKGLLCTESEYLQEDAILSAGLKVYLHSSTMSHVLRTLKSMPAATLRVALSLRRQ